MIKGLYTAASGMLSNSQAINTISNNVANASTAGYKKDDVVFSSFGDALTYRIGGSGTAAVGGTTNGVCVGEVFTNYEQAPLEQTGGTLDLALEGEGFFTVRMNDGALALTRNGQFAVDTEGYLTDVMGNQVLGENGALQVGDASFRVSTSGEVYVDGQYLDTLRITCPADLQGLEKQEGGLLTGFEGQEQLAFTGNVQQGYLETAGLDLAEEITSLIESSRAFQSCSQLVKMMDTILEKTVNEIGKV